MNKIKLSGTGLERNRKIQPHDKAQIKILYNKGYTQKQIAEMYDVSPAAIWYCLLSGKKRKLYRQRDTERKSLWYNSKSKEERSRLSKKWAESTKAYIQQLGLVKEINLLNK